MATKIGIGVSTQLDSFVAGKEAAKVAFYKLARQDPNILIVFISPIFNQAEAIKGICSVFDKPPLIGCSSAGCITSLGSFRNSVGVCAIESDSITFSYGLGKGVSKSPRSAGNTAARQSSNLKDGRQAYLMLSDGLSGSGTDILRGAQEAMGTSFPIIGGFASDDLQFLKTYQYFNNNIYTDCVVGLYICGEINVTVGKAHGWQPIGKPHKITKARSNIIKEIDRRKAIELYEGYLGKSLDELRIEGMGKLGSSYPLGMRVKETDECLIRTPLKIGDNGSLILSAEIPEREDINLMIGDINSALEATKKACEEALGNIKRSRIRFALVFSDIGRLQLLRKDSEKEVEIIKDVIGKDVPFFGCYTCGEYAALDSYSGQSYFHNEVISIALFLE